MPFTPDSMTGNMTVTDPAVKFVELAKVVPNSDSRFGNFLSILTVDLVQLEEQSVNSISCGDPGTSQTLPVNVVIIRETVPDSPNITRVDATYNSTGLRSVTVAWNKLVRTFSFNT